MLSPAGAGIILSALPPLWLSAHTADPGGSGAFEITASPYVRQAVSVSAPSGSQMVSAALIALPLPAGVPVYYLGLWNAQGAGEFLGSTPLTLPDGSAGVVLTSAGTVPIPVGDLIVVAGGS